MAIRPNILIMMTDQQRFDSLSCYGCEVIHTPNLDRLATQGVLFEHCYVNNPLCTPSRASMMTGKHLPGHGLYRLYDNLPDDEVLFTEHLQRLGYHTALFGKMHVSSVTYEAEKRHPHDGFDIYEWCLEPSLCMEAPHNGYARWLQRTNPEFYEQLRELKHKLHNIPYEVHMTRWAAERTIDYIHNSTEDRPFFCMMSVFDPHNPYNDYPLEMAERVNEDKISKPILMEGEHDGTILERILTESSGSNNPDLERVHEARVGYHASIALMDLEVGRVLDALEEKGIADETLVIFLSDHGDMLWDHGFNNKGAFLYDPCVRVPFIARWPERFRSGVRLDQLIQPNDIAATCLTAAGMDEDELQRVMPDSMDLSRVCAGEQQDTHPYVVCLHRNSGLAKGQPDSYYFNPPIHASMIRNERHKLVLYHAVGGSIQQCEGQLFDMREDPLEINNLFNDTDYHSIRLDMTQSLMDWMVSQEIRQCGSRVGGSTPRWWPARSKSL